MHMKGPKYTVVNKLHSYDEFETINYLKKKTINIKNYGDDILYLKNYHPPHLMDQIDSKWTKWTEWDQSRLNGPNRTKVDRSGQNGLNRTDVNRNRTK